MRTFNLTVVGLCIIVFLGCRQEQQESPGLLQGEPIDLTYSYNDQTVFWPTADGFELKKGPEGVTEQGYFYSANSFSMAEHGGTHIDAPYHFWEEGNTLDEIPVEQLMGDAIVVDVSDSALANPDYQVAVDDFQSWEHKHGRIPKDVIVLLRTGFGQYWPDREAYMGTDERGEEAVPKLHFPGLHPDAARWLTEQRSVKLIGIDTPSIDYGQSESFESHVILFKHNIPALENLADMDQLPASGFEIMALPMKIEGGSGGPVRVVARLGKK